MRLAKRFGFYWWCRCFRRDGFGFRLSRRRRTCRCSSFYLSRQDLILPNRTRCRPELRQQRQIGRFHHSLKVPIRTIRQRMVFLKCQRHRRVLRRRIDVFSTLDIPHLRVVQPKNRTGIFCVLLQNDREIRIRETRKVRPFLLNNTGQLPNFLVFSTREPMHRPKGVRCRCCLCSCCRRFFGRRCGFCDGLLRDSRHSGIIFIKRFSMYTTHRLIFCEQISTRLGTNCPIRIEILLMHPIPCRYRAIRFWIC